MERDDNYLKLTDCDDPLLQEAARVFPINGETRLVYCDCGKLYAPYYDQYLKQEVIVLDRPAGPRHNFIIGYGPTTNILAVRVNL